jgi:hypothetical protein
MRIIALAIAVAASIAAGAIALRAQSNKRIVYFSSDRERTVTVSQSAAGIVSFVIPVGTTMALSYESPAPPNLMAKPMKVHGSVQVRMLRDSDLHGLQAEAMLLAPIAISAEEVDVEVRDGR